MAFGDRPYNYEPRYILALSGVRGKYMQISSGVNIAQNPLKKIKPKGKTTAGNKFEPINSEELANPLRLSVTEAAKIGGVQTKTIRRAIQFNSVKYKIIGNRYLIDLTSILTYLHSKTKLMNKFYQFGLGQYIDKWKSNK